ncbi:uncharacterized protein LOC114721737 [Neltuma alba]|uniref:uncharacterized protein LOC114721737 n=1 Tax=Neltuma alba TaxID=207710 RepID=UPI0010A50EBD|nr:uncharacterized protein LOC114721737 [Prosopis alba]
MFAAAHREFQVGVVFRAGLAAAKSWEHCGEVVQARQEQEKDAAIATTIAAVLAQLQQPKQGIAETAQPWIVEFGKHHPPGFKGTFDVQVAEDWITRLEKIFNILECPFERKAQMVIYKIEGEADRWWKNTELVLQANGTLITWEVFKDQFFLKYFPRSMTDEKEAKFLTIKQAMNKPFDKYLVRYIKLFRNSTYL